MAQMILSTRIRALTALVAAAILAVVATTANAATLNWNVAGPADWAIGGNWNPPGFPPGTGDRADISNGGTAYIDSDVGTIQRFEMAGPVGTSGFLEIRSGGSLTTNDSGNTYVGSRGVGILTIEPGATLNIASGPFYVGWRGDAGAHGDGSVIQNGGTVTMGRYVDLAREDANTEGRYEIHDGTLTIAEWIQIGRQGTGTFVQTDGIVTVNRSGDAVIVGAQGNSTGTYTMSGGELRIPIGNLYLGQSGDAVGTFDLSHGIVTVGTQLILGNQSGNTGTVNQSGGTINVPSSGNAVYVGRKGIGHYTMNGGELNVPNGYMYVGGEEAAGDPGDGTFIQNGGDVVLGSALRMATHNAGAKGHYEIHGGSLTVASYLQVARNGTAEVIQTGGTVTVNRTGAEALVLADASGSQSSYTISGGHLVVANHDIRVGKGGTALLDVLGSAADIDVAGYRQNGLSTLRSAIDNGGISTVDVSGTATISGGAMLDVDIYGGVALTQTTAFDLLRTATAGNVSGTFTVVDPEPVWAVTQDGTVVQAALAGPGQGTVTAGYGVPGEILVGGGAGSSNDWVAVDGMWPGEQTFVFLDIIEPGDTVDSAELDALAAYISSGGNPAYSNHPLTAPGTGLDKYDLAVEFFPSTTTGYLAWDLTDFNAENGKNLVVAGLAVGVPEPGSLALLGLGLIGLGLAGIRTRRHGAGGLLGANR